MAAGNLELFAEGAVTLAVGSWTIQSSGLAGAGFADDCNLLFNSPGNQSITGSLDWSALGTTDPNDGPYALDFVSPFAAFVGSGAGPLIVSVAGDAYSELAQNSRIKAWGAGGSIYWSGGAGGCQLLMVGGAMKFFAVAGYLTYVIVQGGSLNVNAVVTFTDAGRVSLCGGVSFVDASSDLIGMCIVTEGSHTMKRGGVASTGILRVEGGTLTLDCNNKAWPKIVVTGNGTLVWKSAAAPGTTVPTGAAEADVEFRSGTVDFTNTAVPVAITFRGYPTCTLKGASNPLVTLTEYKQGSGCKREG